MWTPNEAAYSMAAMACPSKPQSPSAGLLMNLRAMIFTDGATPDHALRR